MNFHRSGKSQRTLMYTAILLYLCCACLYGSIRNGSRRHPRRGRTFTLEENHQ